MKLTKADIIDRVYAANPQMSKDQAREAVEIIIRTIKTSLENGDDVLLSRFGKFNVRSKSARRGRNPKTGEPLMLEARRVVTFKSSGMLRNKMNGKWSILPRQMSNQILA
jgi:integration host factor subunit alpha